MDETKCTGCNDKDTGRCSTGQCPGSSYLPQNEASDIKNVLAVMSGKGGVGKSSVSALLAVALARRGYKTGILDADITGPSIPKIFGLVDRPEQFKNYILPVKTALGIQVMSLNLFLPSEDDPVIWRGPILASAVKQFWSDVAWGDLDYLIVDMPPGTGDIPLTVMQSLPLNGLLAVSSPQDLAMMVVSKTIKMARQASIPILGLVENLSYISCPHCGEKIQPFGNGSVKEAASKTGLPLLAVLPVDPELAKLADAGRIEDYEGESLKKLEPLVEVVVNKKTPA
ncbi:Chromosome partitioning ATPase, Mrp family, contains Fe-S cluster [Desulfofundulus australicus DSM 11792]|uniref:Iron-sulfur cluster carrier protein n=1 Tax=Desulfofundulus australicus DSM 11792 TaxID=1121425 RepID=A0A1M5DY01_9FIRM|nr:Mrp/NBP35 family ATP-binding protein [Desulfofundulus australicus]SHF71877.1 Chromosome partitioning ATPase, Mrp family, contains Fe-S cluster [Desulfofundulus australicus DSM 11792]